MKTKKRAQLRIDRRARSFKKDIRVRKQIRKLEERSEHGTRMVVHNISGGLKALVHERTNQPRPRVLSINFKPSKKKFHPRGLPYQETVRDARGNLRTVTFNQKLKEQK